MGITLGLYWEYIGMEGQIRVASCLSAILGYILGSSAP